VKAEFFHTEDQTERPGEGNIRFSKFCQRA